MSTKKSTPKGTSHAKKSSFRDVFYQKYAPMITGVGASIVILGALFKLQHWPGAGLMLTVGMLIEAGIFLLFAFAPQPHEYDWSLVYPELSGNNAAAPRANGTEVAVVKPENILERLDKAIDKGVFDRLGSSMKELSTSVSSMGEVTKATVATQEYAVNVQNASRSLQDMTKSYSDTIKAMSSMSAATTDAQKYHEQVMSVTKNLTALNAVYEMELKDTNSHLKALNKFYGNLGNAMETVSEASKDATQLKTEMGKLSGNLSGLNKVYGGMLTAMKA